MVGHRKPVNFEIGQLFGKFRTRGKHNDLDPITINVDLQRKKNGLAKFRLMVIRASVN
jgi:hypothetical protein